MSEAINFVTFEVGRAGCQPWNVVIGTQIINMDSYEAIDEVPISSEVYTAPR